MDLPLPQMPSLGRFLRGTGVKDAATLGTLRGKEKAAGFREGSAQPTS